MMYRRNEIVTYDDHAEIVIRDKNFTEVARALIDLDDMDRVSTIVWGLHGKKRSYIRNRGIGYLHRFIMRATDGMEVDHINSPLDNRKRFLRLVVHADNGKYTRMRTTNVSGFKGVAWEACTMKWRAWIKVDGKNFPLGRFRIARDAARAYDCAALEYFGQFALTNEMLGLLHA